MQFRLPGARVRRKFMTLHAAGLTLIGATVLVVGACTAVTHRSSIEAISAPARTSFDAALIGKGAELAAVGNCMSCHTTPGGAAYAGGVALHTPFGTIYTTNITPDVETGIGTWSEAAFSRALHEGVDREGDHLYPAFPYDHFARVADDDVSALYAFMMTRTPVRSQKRKNELYFPFNIRALLAVWKTLFLKRQRFEPDAGQSPEWNRGAYLVEGLAHCGACHTPRNLLGAEDAHRPYAGGETEGWRAPALNDASPAPVPWTADRIHAYLRRGMDDVHDAAAGPMEPVVHNLGKIPDAEVRAIATYVESIAGPPGANREKKASAVLARAKRETGPNAQPTTSAAAQREDDQTSQDGARTYAGACAPCHDNGRQASSSGHALYLALSTAIAAPHPDDAINVLLHGITPREGEQGPWMPAFGSILTDKQAADVLAYLRRRFSDQPAWGDVDAQVRRARESAGSERS